MRAGLAVVLIVVAGCLAPAPAREVPPIQAPPVPEGFAAAEATQLLANATAVTWRWEGVLEGAPTAVATTTFTVPGTAALRIEASLQADADARLEILDGYGMPVCRAHVAEDATYACAFDEVAPLGWEQTWTLRATAEDAQVALPFTVDVTFATLPRDLAPPTVPAGLSEIVPFEVAADDGIRLSGHVYLPGVPPPFPTVLHFSPYLNANAGDQSEAQAIDVDGRRTMRWENDAPLGPLLDAGYAVALVNLRGTGESGGCATLFDLDRDGRDAYAVVEALADEPWSNGRVGMIGISWHAYSQYAAMGAKPPSLAAVAPASSIVDPWLLWTRHGSPIAAGYGVTSTTFWAANVLANAGFASAGGDRSPDHLACPEHAANAVEFARMNDLGDESPFWASRRAFDALGSSDVPVLATNGLLAPAQEGHILQVDDLWPVLPRGSRLLVGQWSHQFPHERGEGRYLSLLLDFFDAHLRDGPPVDVPPVQYEDRDGTWRAAEAWPPPGRTVRLHLSGDTLVADGEAVSAGTQRFPTVEGDSPSPTRCPFQAVYASPPLAEDLDLAGNFQVSLPITSTEPDGNLVAFLFQASEVPECLGDSDARLVARATTDLRHRGTLRVGEPFPVNSEEVVLLRGYPFAATVPAGARLVLAVGGDDDGEVHDKPQHPVLSVRTGEDAGAWLDIPVVGDAPVFSDP